MMSGVLRAQAVGRRRIRRREHMAGKAACRYVLAWRMRVRSPVSLRRLAKSCARCAVLGLNGSDSHSVSRRERLIAAVWTKRLSGFASGWREGGKCKRSASRAVRRMARLRIASSVRGSHVRLTVATACMRQQA